MKLFFAFQLIALLLSSSTAHADYILGGDKIEEQVKPRSSLSGDGIFTHIVTKFNTGIYDFLTVAVFGPGSPGSGVIIANKNNEYYVITAKHVLSGLNKGEEIDIQTIDGKHHVAYLLAIDDQIDGALLKFKSMNKYYPAFVEPLIKPILGMKVLVQGYALASKEANKGSLRRSLGSILTVIDGNQDGYDLLYDATTNIGMSGGGIYSDYDEGRTQTGKSVGAGYWKCDGFEIPVLIGMHGRSESYIRGGKSGANMGISIHTLLTRFAKSLANEGITSLPDELDTLLYKDACKVWKCFKNEWMDPDGDVKNNKC